MSMKGNKISAICTLFIFLYFSHIKGGKTLQGESKTAAGVLAFALSFRSCLKEVAHIEVW